MVGPSLIFDKSALQALNPDEAMWLDNFYICNVTPLFFVETLADLEKEVRAGKTPEEVVGHIAHKSPDSACINVHHESLLYGELMGKGAVEMSGRPIISGGRTVKLGDETGVIFEEPPEVEAFHRWQDHKFLEVERNIAKKWRDRLKTTNSEESIKLFQQFLNVFGMPKSFDELKQFVDRILNDKYPEKTLKFAFLFLGVPPEDQRGIIQRWEDAGKKPVREFAPYMMHKISVDLFFYFGTAANLFSNFRHAQTHKVDIAYLYYLPFCNIFVSNDKIHKVIASYFMRPNQTFIWGEDFKADLTKLDKYYSAFPEEVKNRGVVTFAFIPPDDKSFLTTQMWDKYMSSKWRDMKARKFDGTDEIDPEKEKAILEKIRNFVKNAKTIDHNELPDSDEARNMTLAHKISARKGKWTRFPPEVLNSKNKIMD